MIFYITDLAVSFGIGILLTFVLAAIGGFNRGDAIQISFTALVLTPGFAFMFVGIATSDNIDTRISSALADEFEVESAKQTADGFLIEGKEYRCEGLPSFADMRDDVKNRLPTFGNRDVVETEVRAVVAEATAGDYTCTLYTGPPETFGSKENS